MAYIEKTAFEARITNNEFNDLCNVTGLFQTEGADDVCSAGFLCVRNGQLPNEGFEGVLNENAWYMKAAGADVNANEVIYASNTYETKMVSFGGNDYHIGRATLGLPIPKGRRGTFTVVEFDNQHVYSFGEGNIKGSIGENTFFTIEDGLLVPAAAAPTAVGSLYFKLRSSDNFVEGVRNSFGRYDFVACKVAAATA